MKPKAINEIFKVLSEEQRAILFALSGDSSDSVVNLPTVSLEEKLSVRYVKGSSKITYPGGRVKYKVMVDKVVTLPVDLKLGILPPISWESVILNESQIELKSKFYSYLESLKITTSKTDS